MNVKAILLCASFYGLCTVVLGAFGAHALKSTLNETMLNAFNTGVKYQGIHACVLLFVGLITLHSSQPLFRWAALSFVVGTLLFSGSLYALALGGPRWLGPITPIGGMGLIIGWVLLMVASSKLEL